MSGPLVHVRIGRLVVDAPMRGDASHWDMAIARALQAELVHARASEAHVPNAIARQVAPHVRLSMDGGRDAGR